MRWAASPHQSAPVPQPGTATPAPLAALPLPTLSQLYLQRVSIYFQTNCVCEPTTRGHGPAVGPGTCALPGAIQCNLGSLLPKKAQTLTPTQATQRPPRTGLTEGSALLYCQIMYPLFFPLALKIPFASVSLLNTLQPPQFLISPKHSEFHPNTANPRAPTQAATPKPRSSPALTHSPQKVLLTPLP